MRITIERNGDIFRFSALSETAVVPVRQVEIQSFFATGAAARLMESQTIEEQERYGRLLHTYLFPEDFRQLIDGDKPLTLILDRSSAAVTSLKQRSRIWWTSSGSSFRPGR